MIWTKGRRIARSKRYDNRAVQRFDEVSPDTTTARSEISEWYLYLAALPTAKGDAVVLGKVIDAKLLVQRQTAAYSEFTVLYR